MAFFDKLTDAASNLGDKAGDAIEITKLKSRISSEKKAIELELAKVGKIYYEKNKAGEEIPEEIKEICSRVDGHYNAIAEIEKTLELYTEPKIK